MSDEFGEYLARFNERREQAPALYQAMLTSGRLPQQRRLTYRCTARRCLLLDAVETPLGTLLHQDRYKYSEAENLRRSSESGRQKNTYDGATHWRERTYWLEQSALAHPSRPDVIGGETMRLGVSCDHVLDAQLTADEFVQHWQAGHAEVRIRPDGSRFAVD